ncbi:hypothetical protein [Actinokineospora globicatena]|uniref:hypothetical protein n=1 Tax=Actinokineospora globicatena TaxID=103729 RepID=UPI0020A498AF|nr:hypothetical protein [Actinokineospora globicatena]
MGRVVVVVVTGGTVVVGFGVVLVTSAAVVVVDKTVVVDDSAEDADDVADEVKPGDVGVDKIACEVGSSAGGSPCPEAGIGSGTDSAAGRAPGKSTGAAVSNPS